MSTDRDTTRIVRSWLEEGATALPDRVLDAVLDQLPATRQRRPLWPARTLRLMDSPMRLAAAVVVLVVVAALGFTLMSNPGLVGGPFATPTPTATPVASPTPSATVPPSPATLTPGEMCTTTSCSVGNLDPGTYSIPAGRITPAGFTFTVPAGWSTTEGFVSKHSGAANEVLLVTWIVTHAYTDICQWNSALVDAGTTPDQLASILVGQGRSASAVTDVDLGGFPAKRMELTVPADLDVTKCDPAPGGTGMIRFWPDPGPDEGGGLCCSPVGSTDVVYIVDVAGKRLAVVARHQPGSSAEDIAELEGIVASISIDAPPPSPSPPGPSPSQ
jgi:hypothetical protein